MRRFGARSIGALAAVILLAGACGTENGDGDAGNEATGGGTGTTPAGGYYGGTPIGETGTTGSTGATGETGAGAGAGATVALNNYLFQPADLEVASGADLEVENANSRTPHTFTVVGEDVDVELAPLTSETTTIDLPPGTYDVICRFHQELGMTGTMTVT